MGQVLLWNLNIWQSLYTAYVSEHKRINRTLHKTHLQIKAKINKKYKNLTYFKHFWPYLIGFVPDVHLM